MPEPERVLTRVRWACGEMMTNDTRTEGQVGHHGIAVVNGPEDEPLDWHQVDWCQAEDDVRRLRQRIFTASRVGLRPYRAAFGACLSRMRGNVHVRF